MSARVEHAAAVVYQGIWAVLAGWFRVPAEAPDLPAVDGREPERFRPSPGYLAYLKFMFWLFLLIVDIAIVGTWIIVVVVEPWLGVLLFVPMLALAIVPDVVAYIALRLRYDTMWYVMNERSIRIRRGIWIIQETTITFENIQNVLVTQGPLQRWFGIASVVIQTAGGGGGGAHPSQQGGHSHLGLIEGVADAPRLRDLFLAKMKAARGAGLGDERHEETVPGRAEGARAGAAWTPAHIIALREMLEEARRMNVVVR